MRPAWLVLLLALPTGCPGPDEHPRARAQRPRREPEKSDEPVYARGDGVLVTAAEVEARARRTGESPRDAAQTLVEESVLTAAAERAGLAGDREALRTKRRVLVQRLLLEEVERKVTAESIPRAAVEEEYQRRIAEFVHGDRVRVEHFLVKVAENAMPERTSEARMLAETVRDTARDAPGQSLDVHEALAPEGMEVTVEALPWFERGSVYDPAFEAAALRLRRENEISRVVRTRFGFHVIRLLERVPAKRVSFEEVESDLRVQMLPRMRSDRLRELVAELGNRRGVNVDPRPLSRLVQ